jgi:DNA-directed RNA polymerase subunit RPC12/RpoP
MAWFIDADKLLADIEALKMSAWYEFGKNPDQTIAHCWYLSRVDAVNKVRELCVKPQNVVDAEPVKTAQLIRETDRERHWHCSRCGKVFGLVGLMHKYCPECGARLMGGGRDAD